MDFGTLLQIAKQNREKNKDETKFYSTKFSPPKKESKDKKLSDNIQKFLRKREQEDREKQLEEKRKLENLLSMRDQKSKNKIRKMLKVTKSANKSVIDDAVSEHTAVTMQGPHQPDEDDYGYVSREANAFYQKYIEKVKNVQDDKGFAPSRPHTIKDISGTKERVKAAMSSKVDEKKLPIRQQTRNTPSMAGKDLDTMTRKDALPQLIKESKEMEKKNVIKNRKPPPPPMDFQTLLKLAEKKQHEPVQIIQEVKKKSEPERLLTSKEKLELEERRRIKEQRKEKPRKEIIGKTTANERVNKTENLPVPTPNQNGKTKIACLTNGASNKTITNSKTDKPNLERKGKDETIASKKLLVPSKDSKHISLNGKTNSAGSSIPKNNPSSSVKSTLPVVSTSAKSDVKTSKTNLPSNSSKLKPVSLPNPQQVKQNVYPFNGAKKSTHSNQVSKKNQTLKRRILDDDDEYDSELDDFIDDNDVDEDYSSHIKAIFGYDKSKYRDWDDDDGAMESNFAQVQREEYISKKIGIQEDLEDMKIEALEKKRKAMKQKKMKMR